MSEQNNTSFAHAFLPGLILGLIVGAVAGAFVPEMMSGTKIKIDPAARSTAPSHERDAPPTQDDIDAQTQELIDAAENAAENAADDAIDAIDAIDATEDIIDDAKNALPDAP